MRRYEEICGRHEGADLVASGILLEALRVREFVVVVGQDDVRLKLHLVPLVVCRIVVLKARRVPIGAIDDWWGEVGVAVVGFINLLHELEDVQKAAQRVTMQGASNASRTVSSTKLTVSSD